MRYLIWSIFFIPCIALSAQPRPALDRKKCEVIIKEQFPEFHILREADFPKVYQGKFRDGTSGALIYGHFYPGKQLDFAALLIGAKASQYSFKSALVICKADKKKFTCRLVSEGLHYSDAADELSLTPPGKYSCVEDENAYSTFDLKLDAIGRTSERGGEFFAPLPDGSFKNCVTTE